ncbi:MAG: hypothetical protein NT023_17825 [Armatimonadetes bacterium]|nr:hypothetical protein [Armatimonadota bacterium]
MTISYKPPITLILGESGSGKTDHLLQRFTESLGHSLLIMASDTQAKRLDTQLLILRSLFSPFAKWWGI